MESVCQNLKCNKTFIVNPGCLGKYCSLSCGTAHRNETNRNNKVQNYLINPKKCQQCQSSLSYKKRNNKFCSHSCAAQYSNALKDWGKIKCGPSKTGRKKYAKPYIEIQCAICRKSFLCNTSRKTCSKTCSKTMLSNIMKSRIYNGFNPNSHRGRNKKSYMEASFEEWLHNHGVYNFVTEEPFHRLDKIKTYLADFYFPDKKLIIELDGTQHQQTVTKDKERDEYISSTYNITILRISYAEYKNKSRVDEIKNLLDIK